MYSDPNLDAPPPRSQFRRPWSPEPFVPYHPSSPVGREDDHGYGFSDVHHDLYSNMPLSSQQKENQEARPHSRGTSPHRLQQKQKQKQKQTQRREASDVSVEALDLADYARTLRFRQAEDPYPPFPSQLGRGNGNGNGNENENENENDNARLGSSIPVIPGLPGSRSRMISPTRIQMQMQMRMQPRPPPNSLVSRGTGTLSSSSNNTHQTLSSAQSRGRPSSRRPFSMPVTPQASSSRVHFSGDSINVMDNGVPPPPPDTYARLNRGPYVVDPEMDVGFGSSSSNAKEEIDISHFPKWSRGWYRTPTNQNQNRPPAPDAVVDLYDPIPPSRLHFDNNNTRSAGGASASAAAPISPFDPAYVHDRYIHPNTHYNNDNDNSHYPYGFGSQTYDVPSSSSPPPPLSSLGHGSNSMRDLLPWSNDPPEYGLPPLDPLQKEERMRMLEREFGGGKGNGNGKGKGKGKDDGRSFLVDEEGRPLVGTVDERGRLVTVGPKRRVVLRSVQLLLAVGACVPALYAAVAIKPPDPKKPPPPANKPPVFVLYVLSVLTLLLLLYMFVIRPCCVVRHKPRSSSADHPLGMGMGAGMGMGMMVLPVGNGGFGKGKGRKGKKDGGGGKGKGRGGGRGKGDGDVQVNLIVDPDAFRLPGDDSGDSEDGSSSEEEEYEYDYNLAQGMGMGMGKGNGMPGGLPILHHHHQQRKEKEKEKEKRKKRNRRRRRRGIREGLMMEEQWKVARAWAKKLAMLDVGGVVLWGAAFVLMMMGKRCPSGMFNGWCNAYNVSTASGCLLCVAFGVSLFFDVQDLHASKQSPRTRTK